MIYITLAKDMGLTQVRAINADLKGLAGTEFIRRTWSWTTPSDNLAAVMDLAKKHPIVVNSYC